MRGCVLPNISAARIGSRRPARPSACICSTRRARNIRPATASVSLRLCVANRRHRRVREAGLPCVSGDELVSLGFRVGNSSAIGWHQRANFPASLLPVGVTPTTSRRNRDARFAPKNGPEAQAER